MDKADKVVIVFAGVFYSIFFGFMIPTVVEVTSETQHNQESMRDFLLVACGVSEGVEFAIADFKNKDETIEFYNGIFDRCMYDTDEKIGRAFGEAKLQTEDIDDVLHTLDHKKMILCAIGEVIRVLTEDGISDSPVEEILEECLE